MDGTSSSSSAATLHEIKISELPVATAANATDQLEANQAGVSRSITVGQIAGAVSAASGVIDLAGLGIVSDGTDKTALLNQIFVTYGAAAYRLTKVGSGTMLTSGTVNMPNGGVVTMADDVVWEAALISFQGSIGTMQNFTARTAKDAVSFAFDTTGIGVDDWVYLFGCTNLGSIDAGVEQLTWSADLSPVLQVYPGQFMRARTVTPTTLTTLSGARWAYEITPGPASGARTVSQAFKVNFITGGIRGGTIRVWTGATANALITMSWARQVFIDGVRFDMMPSELHQCVNLQKSLNCWVRNCTVERHIDGGTSTLRNSFQVQSCQGLDFSRNIVTGGNQDFDISIMIDGTATPSFDCSITHNTVVEATEGATTHPGSTDIRIDNNRFINCTNGIRIRTPRSSASCNTLINESNIGVGISLQNGFFDGTIVLGNIIDGFVQGITADFRSSGALLPVTTVWTDNIVRNAVTGLLVMNATPQLDASIKAVVIRGGEIGGAQSIWTDFRTYCNGLTIEGVTFSGTASLPPSGVIVLPANTTNVRIGTNYFRGTGSLPCIYGPGATVISDLAVFPAGEAAAKWTIKEQVVIGGTGAQSANMPTSVAAYAPGSPALWTSELGKLSGTSATAAATILGTATTVAHVVQAFNQLIYPAALPFRVLFDFMPGTMPGSAALTRASVGWSLGSSGLLASSAIDVARFQYDNAAVLRGLLNEPTRTNLVWISQTLTGSATLTQTRAALTANATTAPTGALTAPKLVEDTTATQTHGQNVFPGSVTSGTTYTLSVFAKAGERTSFRLRFSSSFPASTNAIFNLSTGTIGTVSGSASPSMTAYPNGWYRCAISTAASATGTGSAVMDMIQGTVTTTYTGDGVSGFYLWGAQFEAGSMASYIDTTAAAVTRSPDVLTLTLANGTYNIDIIREAGTTTLPGVVVGAGTYVVPTDPSPLQKVVFR